MFSAVPSPAVNASHNAAQDTIFLTGYRGTLPLTWCAQLGVHQDPQGLFSQASFQSVPGWKLPASPGAWGCSSPAAALGICLCWAPWHSCWPISPLYWGPSGWHHSLWCINHSSQFFILCKFPWQSVGFSSQAAAGHSATQSFCQDFHQHKGGIVPRQPNVPRAVSSVPLLGHLCTEQVCVAAAPSLTPVSDNHWAKATGIDVGFLVGDWCLPCFIFCQKLSPYPCGFPPSAQLH